MTPGLLEKPNEPQSDMPKTATLSGIAWDHPRGYAPLLATSIEFSRQHPGVHIEWNTRSLKAFGDTPIEELIETYDLITIDHPYMGQAHAHRLLLPLDEFISNDVLETLAQQSVGPSFQSYYYQSHIYALPIDAAAQVAASRDDLIVQLKVSLPQTRTEIFNFYQRIPNSHAVAWPLCPTDLWCSFLTLCAQDAGQLFMEQYSLKAKVGIAVLDELKLHLQYLHPESLDWNPIQVLDQMGASDNILYAPLLFGYTNYARVGYAKNLVTFSNSPTNSKMNVSTILGGVGLAISSKCQHVDMAIAYLKYVASAKTQTGIYTQHGGQPGNIIAWKNKANNMRCNNFFSNTLATMRKAYVRPQHPGWNQFQEQGADLLHKGLLKDIPSARIIKDLNQLYQSIIQHEQKL